MSDTGSTHKSFEWSAPIRALASAAVCFHIVCVFVGPWSSPPPSTQLSQDFGRVLSPYIKFMAIDNGYRFFAPDPGPSHLVRYEFEFSDKSKRSGVFPSRSEHWPRLLYHRFFMLSETMFTLGQPVLDAPAVTTMTAAEKESYLRQKRQVESLQSSVANYLLQHEPTAVSVRLFTVIHELPTADEVLRGKPLDDPTLYDEFLLGKYAR